MDRKRSRGDCGSNSVATGPFPERAGVNRKTKLAIDVDNLPLLNNDFYEVPEGFIAEMHRQEEEYAPDADYLGRHGELTTRMRLVLLDWMNEVCQEYGLKRETFHYAVNFVDRYLSRKESVGKGDLQLIGVTALWLASKMEEIFPPPVSDFAAATDGGCTQAQIAEMESIMTQVLGWKLTPSTSFAFALFYLQSLACNTRRKMQAGSADEEQKPWMTPSFVPHQQLNRVMEILDLALLDFDSLCFSPSILAASAVLSLVERDNSSVVTVSDVEEATGYARIELEDCKTWFAFFLSLRPAPDYAHRPLVVANVPPQERHLLQRHNPHALLLLKASFQQRNPLDHEAALRHWKRVNSIAIVDEDSDEDLDELRALVAQPQNRMVESLRQGGRAYSPMSQISMSLASTNLVKRDSFDMNKNNEIVTEDPFDEKPESSPQRKIQF